MTKHQLNTALTRCQKTLEAAKNCCGRMFVSYDYEYYDENSRGKNGSWSLEIKLTDLNTFADPVRQIQEFDESNQLVFKPVYEGIFNALKDMDLEIGVYALNPGNFSVIEVD